jgi:hypothetical protein
MNMWPHGVTTRSDMGKFCRLIAGPLAQIEDYQLRLPYATNEAFLFFIPGGCTDGTLLRGLGQCIPDLIAEVEERESSVRYNWHNPKKATAVYSKDKAHPHYMTAQLTKAKCVCRATFGGDSQQGHVCTDNQVYKSGTRYASLLEGTMRQNFQVMCQDQSNGSVVELQEPAYLRMAWHAVLNANDHSLGNSIDAHHDGWSTYRFQDPITSCSYGHGGVLVLAQAKTKKNKSCSPDTMLFQRDGDMLVMGGKFQELFTHAVPAREKWPALQEAMGMQLKEWERQGIAKELHIGQVQPLRKCLRYNTTIRWHSSHSNPRCPLASIVASAAAGGVASEALESPEPAGQVTGQVSAGLVRSRMRGLERLGVGIAYQGSTDDRQPEDQGLSRDAVALAAQVPTDDRQPEDQGLSNDAVALAPTAMPYKRTAIQLAKVICGLAGTADIMFSTLQALTVIGNPTDWINERGPLEHCALFVASLELNMRAAHAAVDEEDVADSFERIPVPFGVLHQLQSAFKDRMLLRKLLEDMTGGPASPALFYDTQSYGMRSCLPNQSHLTKIIVTHAQLDKMLACLRVSVLAEKGLLVCDLRDMNHRPTQFQSWLKHSDKPSTNDGYYGTTLIPWHLLQMLFIGFVDVGYVKNLSVRRVYLMKAPCINRCRTIGGRKLAEQLQKSMSQAAGHLRVMDYQAENASSEAPYPEDAYQIALWVCDYDKVVQHDQMKKKAKTVPSSPAADWHSRSDSSWQSTRDGPSYDWQSRAADLQNWSGSSWQTKQEWCRSDWDNSQSSWQ